MVVESQPTGMGNPGLERNQREVELSQRGNDSRERIRSEVRGVGGGQMTGP